MNTFLPYESFAKSVSCLDRQRLGKQRLECKQILNALNLGEESWLYKRENEKNLRVSKKDLSYYFSKVNRPDLWRKTKTPWYKHPITQMWKGFEPLLCFYGYLACKEWLKRGYKDSLLGDFLSGWFHKQIKIPDWINNNLIHESHRANLIRKNPEHYQKLWPKTNLNLPRIYIVNGKIIERI